jgi:tetratricopeptide (TPR) repeat protein
VTIRVAVLLCLALPVVAWAAEEGATTAAELQIRAAALDQQTRYAQADPLYRRALLLDPHSPSLLNNYGNHLLAEGKLEPARQAFEQALQFRPDDPNALLQLGHIATRTNRPTDALDLLAKLGPGVQERGDVVLLRLQALYEGSQVAEADALLNRVLSETANRPDALKTIGSALAEAKQYDRAETVFGKAVELDPKDWDALYALGLSASHAHHLERALPALKTAAAERPGNAAVLYDLAIVQGESERYDAARQTWQAYLLLKPSDEFARREWAFANSVTGRDIDAALRTLRTYADRHPGDAVSLYELGAAESAGAPESALKHLNQALALQPELTAALIARGLLLLRKPDIEAALADFKLAAAREPNNPRVLDRLGQSYLGLDKLPQAVATLRKAARIAPEDSGILLHLGRALAKAGNDEESKTVFARLRQLQARHKEEL